MIESIFFNPWIWIVPILIVLSIVCTVWGIFRLRYDDLSIGGIFGVIGGGLSLVLITPMYFGFMLPPYDSSFYQTYRITGEVTQLESAFSGDEGTMSQVFIAGVEGIDYLIRSDDQRFRTLSVGDDVNLVCEKKFQYFVEPWYDCSIGGTR